jgi:hypothetical protein
MANVFARAVETTRFTQACFVGGGTNWSPRPEGLIAAIANWMDAILKREPIDVADEYTGVAILSSLHPSNSPLSRPLAYRTSHARGATRGGTIPMEEHLSPFAQPIGREGNPRQWNKYRLHFMSMIKTWGTVAFSWTLVNTDV